MASLPRGVPFIDVLAPAGSAALAAELQTRLDLVGGGLWKVTPDDGTFEESPVPSQPVRGDLDRIWIWRQQPYMPGESFDMFASMAVECALSLDAHLAAAGVYGAFSWGAVVVSDLRWLHGLLLLDWLYNPRLDEKGEVVREPPEDGGEATLRAKAALFHGLWSLEGTARLEAAIPPGAMQVVETHQVLMLVGADGAFDPRYWQGLAMQLVLPDVRQLAADQGDGMPGAPPAPLGAKAPTPAAPAAAPAAEPDDGLTPLARAEREARLRAQQAADAPEPPPPVEEPVEGPALRWVDGPQGALLFVPGERFDAGDLRRWRDGNTEGQARAERAPGEVLEGWVQAGAPFVTEVSYLSRLFVDNRPMDQGRLVELADDVDGLLVFAAHLPRVSRVLAVVVPAEGDAGRRILVTSDADLEPAALVAAADI